MKNKLRLGVSLLFAASLLTVGGCKPETANSTEVAGVPEPGTVPVAESKAVSVHESPAPELSSKAATPPPACVDCGKVSTITPRAVKGESTGVGAAIGAIVGGLAGHQVGGGNGQRIATVIGAAGGAVAGNTIEKNRNADQVFEIGVAMEDGSFRTVTVADASALAVGTQVYVEGENLRLRQ